ncbi:MAG TPA: hypothetical protein VFG91_08375 [Woeseiaceae bacterium]|nr:hypothetical protein [Woeseiaceae bacterium]
MVCRFLGYAAMGLMLGACDGEIYLRDGVTDGDTFYLAERALHDSDPVLQSWVRYSLARSVCQLKLGGDNPARATSFDCELTAREHLLDTWAEQRDAAGAGGYLDQLRGVQAAGYLEEYVWHYLRKPSWQPPSGLDMEEFASWSRKHLREHEPQTRLTGWWGYAATSAEGFPE